MLNKLTPVAGILTQETLNKELQIQSDLYLQRLKSVASKDIFVERTNETITKLDVEIEKAKEEDNLELVQKYEEGKKSHVKHLELLDFEMEQNQKDLDWVVEMVDRLKSIKVTA